MGIKYKGFLWKIRIPYGGRPKVAEKLFLSIYLSIFLGVKSFENILQLYKSAKSSLGEILSAFEMADFDSINSTVQNLKLP